MSKNFIEIANSGRKNAWGVYPEDLTIIGLDTDDGPGHPLYDSDVHEEVPESFITNIGAVGVLSPILVDKDESDRILVCDGRTRVRAAREVNKRRKELGEPLIMVAVFWDSVRKSKVPDRNRWTSVQVSSNEIRKEKGPLWKAERAKTMVDAGIDVEDVANRFGVGVPQVQKWLILANAGTEIKTAVEADKLSADAAIKLAQVNPALQKTALENALAGKKTTAREVAKTAGKVVPPSKKEVKAAVKSLEAVDNPNAQFAKRVLEWVWKGGDLSEILAGVVPVAPESHQDDKPIDEPKKTAKKAKRVKNEESAESEFGDMIVDKESDHADASSDTALDDAILSVTSPKKSMTVPQIHAALSLVGHDEPMMEVSKRVRELATNGHLTKPSPAGFRRAS